MSTTPIKKGQTFQKRRTGTVREIIGFTKKPDGIRRARMIEPRLIGIKDARETRVRVDQLLKTYEPVAAYHSRY